MKNTTEILADWNLVKGRLKQKFAILTDRDVLLVKGRHEEMVVRLEEKLGKTKAEIYKIIAEL